MRTLQFETEILSSTRTITVHYELPEDSWSPVKLHAVKLGKARWLEDGQSIAYTILDILPVLDRWNIEAIEARIKAHEQHQSEENRLAA